MFLFLFSHMISPEMDGPGRELELEAFRTGDEGHLGQREGGEWYVFQFAIKIASNKTTLQSMGKKQNGKTKSRREQPEELVMEKDRADL